jgi:Serine/threonine protein kinase
MYPPIIHRDVTPDNLIFAKDGTIKLVDFTVAHQFESQRAATVVGKQCYMPPEQFRGQPTIESDIYALGCTLYFVITATDPEPMQPSRPVDVDSGISPRLSAIVEKATAFDAADRFHRVTEMAEELHKIRIAMQQMQKS